MFTVWLYALLALAHSQPVEQQIKRHQSSYTDLTVLNLDKIVKDKIIDSVSWKALYDSPSSPHMHKGIQYFKSLGIPISKSPPARLIRTVSLDGLHQISDPSIIWVWSQHLQDLRYDPHDSDVVIGTEIWQKRNDGKVLKYEPTMVTRHLNFMNIFALETVAGNKKLTYPVVITVFSRGVGSRRLYDKLKRSYVAHDPRTTNLMFSNDANLILMAPQNDDLQFLRLFCMKTSSLSASLGGMAYLLSLSLVSKIISFSLNLWLAQKTSYELLGKVLELELMSSSILFLCRENTRLALMRSLPNRTALNKAVKASDLEWEQDEHALRVNFSYIPLILGTLLVRIGLLYYKVYGGSMDLYIGWGYWVGALIELSIEPCVIYVQKNLLYSIRASAEGSSLLIKCITTIYFFPDQSSSTDGINLGLRAYGIAEVIASLWLFGSYVFLLSRHVSKEQNLYRYWVSMIPTRSPLTGRIFDPYFASVSINFWAQSILKHILTVGDRILLIFLQIPNEQRGIYRLVSDLGSLIARLLFQPLEEIFRNYFSKELTSKITKKTLKSTKILLILILKFHVLFGSFFVFFGPFFTKLLLQTLYQADKATDEAAFVLGMYCLYIPFMGVNGITEAFLQGVGDPQIIRKQSMALLIFWFGFVSTFVITYPILGISGLVIANIVNLLLRIVFAYSYSTTFYKDHFISLIIPRPLVWISLFSSMILLFLLNTLDKFKLLGIGIFCGISTLLIM